eukprot:Clim_evm17s142 gene=Clim_evmTU17s142
MEPDQQPMQGFDAFQGRSNKNVVFFHLLFRTVALVWYIICTWVLNNFVINFIIVTLLLAMDFWFVKNVSGRLLVGLRWWNEVQEDGTTTWRFESRHDQWKPNPAESRTFWTSLYGYPVAWVALGLAALFSISVSWLIIVVVALSLNLSNVYGYTKCRRDAKQQATSMAAGFMSSALAGNMASSLFGGGGNQNTGSANNV